MPDTINRWAVLVSLLTALGLWLYVTMSLGCGQLVPDEIVVAVEAEPFEVTVYSENCSVIDIEGCAKIVCPDGSHTLICPEDL